MVFSLVRQLAFVIRGADEAQRLAAGSFEQSPQAQAKHSDSRNSPFLSVGPNPKRSGSTVLVDVDQNIAGKR